MEPALKIGSHRLPIGFPSASHRVLTSDSRLNAALNVTKALERELGLGLGGLRNDFHQSLFRNQKEKNSD